MKIVQNQPQPATADWNSAIETGNRKIVLGKAWQNTEAEHVF